ncbi:MAG: ribonuclease H-like domain-containing protein [Pirellulaceae bacterium]|jgi:uncharacterized protein YprB with RNaseH-like and TPR domain|nr:ribonuclease H-like domain-containing protein [Pirellulaceae bacterium]MDP7015223.1 ribonuclease H-like domain-containing protein [Pirellulaceae bacterium]
MLRPETLSQLRALQQRKANARRSVRNLAKPRLPDQQPACDRESATIDGSAFVPEKAVLYADGETEPSTSELPTGAGTDEVTHVAGAHWRWRRGLDQLWPGSQAQLAKGAAALRNLTQTAESPHPELLGLCSAFPNRAMFVDLETCGFAGSMIFLIGVLHETDGQLVLDQLLARDYSEERAILHSLWMIAAGNDLLVTYNGKSFDWPCIHDRSTLYKLGRDDRDRPPSGHASSGRAAVTSKRSLSEGDRRPDLQHCDLLHHARRRWRSTLPNCKLQTLEQVICGRRRTGDIAGSEIPHAYHEFVRSRDAWELRSILQHNALDLVTLLQIALRIV